MVSGMKCDLHIHTLLSPCGDDGMLPAMIVEQAKVRNLDVIGITDHNATENIFPVRQAAEKEGLKVLGGMEITSREEVHLLVFVDDKELKNLQSIIYDNLDGKNDENAFGKQLIVDVDGNIIGNNEKLLIGATRLKMEDIVAIVHSMDGIVFASHVDRESYSVIGNLGFIPGNLAFDGVEISPRTTKDAVVCSWKECEKYPIVSFSDAHFLDDIGKTTTVFAVDYISINDIRNSMKDGRYFIAYT